MTKITRYPEALDNDSNLPDIDAEKRMNESGFEHDVQHTLVNQAVIELQKKVGADESEDEESLDWRIRTLEESGGGGGSGGSGLVIAGGIGIGGNVEIPALAGAWLQVTVEGVDYVVPGFVMKTLLAPENVDAGSAILYAPITCRAHQYLPFHEEN